MSELIYKTKLLLSQYVTHDVKRFICSKPNGFEFTSGEAVEIAIAKNGWEKEARPFTPTSTQSDNVIEFIIKKYSDHDGVTKRLHSLEVGANLKLSESFGTIKFQGPGVFIAGGAGITPFISILRSNQNNNSDSNTVIFSNKTPKDTILEKELDILTRGNLVRVYTDEAPPGNKNQRIDESYLAGKISNFKQNFYVCGPPKFTEDINKYLVSLGADPKTVTLER